MQIEKDAVGVFQHPNGFLLVPKIVDLHSDPDLLQDGILLIVAAVTIVRYHNLQFRHFFLP